MAVPINAGGFEQPEFVECGALRFNRLELDVSGASDVAAMIAMVADAADKQAEQAGEVPVLLSVDLVGRTDFHAHLRKLGGDGLLNECREQSGDALGRGEILRVRSRTRPNIDDTKLHSGHGLLAEVMKFMGTLADRPESEISDWISSHLDGELDPTVSEAAGLGAASDGGVAHAGRSTFSTGRELLMACRDLLIDELAPMGDES